MQMKIALAQFDMGWEDKNAAKEKILSLIQAVPPRERMDWLVFPEMTLSGFSPNPKTTSLDAADLAFFSNLARQHSLAVSFGGVEDRRNNLITMDKTGQVISRYSKTHLYCFGHEDASYQPGSTLERFPLQGMTIAPVICFDLRFPYLFWNQAAQTDLFVVISSWPARRAEHWMRLLQARAIENQAYVVGVNRTGRDPSAEYGGNSMIFDPMGKILLDCRSAEGIFCAEVSRGEVLKARAKLPFLKDRRTDLGF